MRTEGTDISSTPSDDDDMLEGQDQEPVTGSGTHLVRVVTKTRVKVKHNRKKKKINVLRGFCLRVDLFTSRWGIGGGWGSWTPDWGG